MQSIAIGGLRSTAEEILRLSQRLQTSISQDKAACSPLVADCLYQAAATYAWLVYKTGSPDMIVSLQILTGCLKILDERWKVAGKVHQPHYAHPLLNRIGEYLKVLNLTKETLYHGDASIPTQNGH